MITIYGIKIKSCQKIRFIQIFIISILTKNKNNCILINIERRYIILIDDTNNVIIAKFECNKSIDLREIKFVPQS